MNVVTFLVITVLIIVSITWTILIRPLWDIQTVLERRHIGKNRRLINYTESTTTTAEKPAAITDEQEDGEDSQSEIVRSTDNDMIRQLDFFQDDKLLLGNLIDDRESRSAAPEDVVPKAGSTLSDSRIRIKLKFINDTLKIVDARLEELLGEFKSRHLHVELTANKFVRLIFSGKILENDSITLGSYRMYNNCLVHCIVHNRGTDANYRSDNGDNINWNSEHDYSTNWVLVILATNVCLLSVWYFMYRHPELLNVPDDVGLVVIVGIFIMLSIGRYVLDSDWP